MGNGCDNYKPPFRSRISMRNQFRRKSHQVARRGRHCEFVWSSPLICNSFPCDYCLGKYKNEKLFRKLLKIMPTNWKIHLYRVPLHFVFHLLSSFSCNFPLSPPSPPSSYSSDFTRPSGRNHIRNTSWINTQNDLATFETSSSFDTVASKHLPSGDAFWILFFFPLSIQSLRWSKSVR